MRRVSSSVQCSSSSGNKSCCSFINANHGHSKEPSLLTNILKELRQKLQKLEPTCGSRGPICHSMMPV